MNCDDFLNQAWNDHATQANQVANKLSDGINLIETSEQSSCRCGVGIERAKIS